MFTPLLKSGGREEQKESPHFAAHVRMDFQSFRFWFWERGGNPLDHSQEVSPRILICHPAWQFQHSGMDDYNESLLLEFEKKSPYPTVSIVSSNVIDQAGPAMTDKIAKTNYQTLMDQGNPQDLLRRWQISILGETSWE